MPLEKILVTGCCGFIGYHLTRRLLVEGYTVQGIDNLNNYYDVALKEGRLNLLLPNKKFHFKGIFLEDKKELEGVFAEYRPRLVIHLAAQAGVRYSLENPRAYIDTNITGYFNVLEVCRRFEVRRLIYASSSSVYGANNEVPFSIHQQTDQPLSLYGATKKSNELMAHVYSHLYNLSTTGLRFFTVYGPWGRPDMAYFSFVKAILEGHSIKVYNNGNMKRDFTYIDDIVEAIFRIILKNPQGPQKPYKIYNIGNCQPVQLTEFISILEELLGKHAKKEYMPLQKEDVLETWADVVDLQKDVGFRPQTPLREGLRNFINWYKGYYKYQEV